LRLNRDTSTGDVVTADDDIVCVEGLGDADGRGSGGSKVGGKTKMVERVLAVVARDGEETS
jgi:hypothetical protein